MAQALKRELNRRRQKLDDISAKRLLKSPMNYIEDKRVALDHLQHRLMAAATNKISAGRNRFTGYAAKLDALSPLKVLGRGYSIAAKDGKVIKSGADVEKGDKISLRMMKDTILCRVEEIQNG